MEHEENTAHAAAQIKTPEAAKNFMLAGKAIFTLVSMKTGTRYTYKVTHKEANGQYAESYMVSFLTGPDNWTNYNYIGRINMQGQFLPKNPAHVPTSGFAYTYKAVAAGLEPKNVEVWHAGKCGRCGRLLTVPSSIEMGLGPECASKGGF